MHAAPLDEQQVKLATLLRALSFSRLTVSLTFITPVPTSKRTLRQSQANSERVRRWPPASNKAAESAPSAAPNGRSLEAGESGVPLQFRPFSTILYRQLVTGIPSVRSRKYLAPQTGFEPAACWLTGDLP